MLPTPESRGRSGALLLAHSLVFLLAAGSVVLRADEAAAAQAVTRIVMIGDSITLGVVTSGLPTVDPAYPAQVEALLGPDFEVHVAACGGTVSKNWRPSSGIPSYCKDTNDPRNLYTRKIADHLPFEIATILLGTNDAIDHFTPLNYYRHIVEIIDGLFADGILSVVLMVAPQLHDPTWSTTEIDLIWDYRDEIFALCESSGDDVHCGPDLTALLNFQDHFDRNAFPWDFGFDIHPNAEGHEVIADALYPVLMALPEPGPAVANLSALITLGLLARMRTRRGKHI